MSKSTSPAGARALGGVVAEPPVVGVGDLVGGKYLVEHVLGSGGMGVVVAAHHVGLGEKVALKVLHQHMLDNREAVRRFEREARAAARIKSEHVARVTDVGELPGGAPYMVMEYLDGIDLLAWIQTRGAMPVERAVVVVLQVCEALAEAHMLGIVHRDLKPANLFYVDRGHGEFLVKVLDFGISKMMEPEADQRLTAVQTIMGSPIYMSPEQMQRKRGVDARTDVWSLGVILFELLTRRPPFEAGTVAELAIQIATEPAPLLSACGVDAPPKLERIVARCLEKHRERRFQNVGELAIALSELAPGAAGSVERVLATLRTDLGGVLRSPSLDISGTPSSSSLAATVMRDSQAPPPERRSRVAAVAALGLAVLATATWGVRRMQDTSTNAVPGPTSTPADVAPAIGLAAGVPPMASASPVSSVASQPPPPPASTPAKRPGAASKHVTPTKPVVDCDPSYYYDARGKKHFKPECFDP